MTVVYASPPLQRELHGACASGNLASVIELTSSFDIKDGLDVSGEFNYPLRSACLHGQIAVVDYLVNFPDEEKRKEITSNENMLAAITTSAEYNQKEVILYFKNNCKKIYQKFLKEKIFNSIIDRLTMSGGLETISFLMGEMPKTTEYNFGLFLSKAIQYEKSECFNYFIPLVPPEQISTEALENILHTCLYNQRFNYLKPLLENTNLDISEHLTFSHFKILLESKFDSLTYIIQNYDYKPKDNIQIQIDEYIKNGDDPEYKKIVFDFKKVMDSHKLNKKLNDDLNKKPNQNKKRKIKKQGKL